MTANERKERPIYSGVLRYFPLALLEVARCSYLGNEQHNPGEPLRWDRAKSTDEADALVRHLLDAGTVDTDGVRHTAKVAWRALALLQKELEAAAFLIPEHEMPEREQSPPFISNERPAIPNGKITYDETRDAAWRTPCRCGRLFTHPDRCAASDSCQAERHPHHMTTAQILDDLP